MTQEFLDRWRSVVFMDRPPFYINSHVNQLHISSLLSVNHLSRPVPVDYINNWNLLKERKNTRQQFPLLICQIFILSGLHI